MKTLILVLFAAFLVQGCAATKLTREEYQQLREQRAELLLLRGGK
jgi:PBP1b-binding outer membrane lipoprotein LpoB